MQSQQHQIKFLRPLSPKTYFVVKSENSDENQVHVEFYKASENGVYEMVNEITHKPESSDELQNYIRNIAKGTYDQKNSIHVYTTLECKKYFELDCPYIRVFSEEMRPKREANKQVVIFVYSKYTSGPRVSQVNFLF